ncbi:MAG: DUF1801 domain-containing protein [Paracoccaceae bacterium]
MSGSKTMPTGQNVSDFLSALEPTRRREQGLALEQLFSRATGFPGQMWGPSIVGYGRSHYRYDSGRSGDFLATGFSPRKAAISIYIMPGYQDYSAIMSRLGKHKLGRSCLYVNKLEDIDLTVLEELIALGLRDLNKIWPVHSV